MSRSRLLSVLAALVCVIVVLHFTATYFHLYFTVWWYDIIVHFLGGAFSGLLILWLRFFSGYLGVSNLPSEALVFCFAVLGTLVIGIGWEVFERMLGNTWSVEGYLLDTSLDVILDLLGSFFAFLFFKNRYMTHEQDI